MRPLTCNKKLCNSRLENKDEGQSRRESAQFCVSFEDTIGRNGKLSSELPSRVIEDSPKISVYDMYGKITNRIYINQMIWPLSRDSSLTLTGRRAVQVLVSGRCRNSRVGENEPSRVAVLRSPVWVVMRL